MTTVERQVAVVRWPDAADLRDELRARGVPRLLLVASGEAPPSDLDPLEDWATDRADAAELRLRVASLEARVAVRTTPVEVADGVLRNGERWVVLGPTEARIASALVASFGAVVTRRDLEAVAWGDHDVRANTTDRQMHRLRVHVRSVGLELHTIRGRGYVLDRGAR